MTSTMENTLNHRFDATLPLETAIHHSCSAALQPRNPFFLEQCSKRAVIAIECAAMSRSCAMLSRHRCNPDNGPLQYWQRNNLERRYSITHGPGNREHNRWLVYASPGCSDSIRRHQPSLP